MANGRYPSVPHCQQGLSENGGDIFNFCNFDGEMMIRIATFGVPYSQRKPAESHRTFSK